jgi:hypothetical protein
MASDLTGLPNLVAGDLYTAISESQVVGFEAEANITKGSPVYLTSDMKVSPSPGGDNAIGIANKTVVTGQMCPVATKGVIKVVAAGAIARGAAVCSAANGKVTQLVDQAVDEGGAAKYTIYYARKLALALIAALVDGDLIFILLGK